MDASGICVRGVQFLFFFLLFFFVFPSFTIEVFRNDVQSEVFRNDVQSRSRGGCLKYGRQRYLCAELSVSFFFSFLPFVFPFPTEVLRSKS